MLRASAHLEAVVTAVGVLVVGRPRPAHLDKAVTSPRRLGVAGPDEPSTPPEPHAECNVSITG